MGTESWWTVPDAGTATTEALARLREQRRLLGLVCDEVEIAGRRLAAESVDEWWRSPAQRSYGHRREELSGELQGAWRSLVGALAAVDEAIVQQKARL
ncbi:hypothetical protein [Cryobacterium arcticum]|uniref:Uncharacterized protein n=1 Tax=Cryobacterium arcticum TaxID=670052 RepID=A0A318A4R7_9MICO|nr:hypothetical protein [Cryobacterium arcticum]PXA72190.1 hypothetical protein CTB96_04670 [Cryobacterium arcticum]